ncbi:hypothetical protein ZIOFF_025408 [Zingiber officinale]|uniref:ATPase AAA-type core domain-containing protein n=1 Tax=Zingiber officinale TaxID=94328 RepID=A0A8J5HE93_ZINOF|nr:hypothetical protein ZIOFF_025408 [Zingiber officinale]
MEMTAAGSAASTAARGLYATPTGPLSSRCRSDEGPRMVWDVFRLAKENAPAIIFIDEVDAIVTAHFDAQTGADREVQRRHSQIVRAAPSAGGSARCWRRRRWPQEAKTEPARGGSGARWGRWQHTLAMARGGGCSAWRQLAKGLRRAPSGSDGAKKL